MIFCIFTKTCGGNPNDFIVLTMQVLARRMESTTTSTGDPPSYSLRDEFYVSETSTEYSNSVSSPTTLDCGSLASPGSLAESNLGTPSSNLAVTSSSSSPPFNVSERRRVTTTVGEMLSSSTVLMNGAIKLKGVMSVNMSRHLHLWSECLVVTAKGSLGME